MQRSVGPAELLEAMRGMASRSLCEHGSPWGIVSAERGECDCRPCRDYATVRRYLDDADSGQFAP